MSKAIATLEARSLASRPAEEPKEQYQWPLALAVLALLLDYGLSAGRTIRRPEGKPTVLPSYRPAAAAVVVAVFLLSCNNGAGAARKGQQLYDQGKYPRSL